MAMVCQRINKLVMDRVRFFSLVQFSEIPIVLCRPPQSRIYAFQIFACQSNSGSDYLRKNSLVFYRIGNSLTNGMKGGPCGGTKVSCI